MGLLTKMKRRAILIESSDVAGYTDLSGARIDIENWADFLQSPLGGAWDSNEITRLHKPPSTRVRTLIENAADGYCFVAFSGHGTDGTVVLNENSTRCPLSILTPLGDRGTMIIDACRGVETAMDFSTVRKSAAILAEQAPVAKHAKEGMTTNFSSLADAKLKNLERTWSASRFKRATGESPAGIVAMHSCASGEEADEDPANGGIYTCALLDAAVKFHFKLEGRTGILDTRQAHQYAVALMPSQQNPEYLPDGLAFPFALKVVPLFVI